MDTYAASVASSGAVARGRRGGGGAGLVPALVPAHSSAHSVAATAVVQLWPPRIVGAAGTANCASNLGIRSMKFATHVIVLLALLDCCNLVMSKRRNRKLRTPAPISTQLGFLEVDLDASLPHLQTSKQVLPLSQQALQSGQIDEALKLFTAWLCLDPNNANGAVIFLAIRSVHTIVLLLFYVVDTVPDICLYSVGRVWSCPQAVCRKS